MKKILSISVAAYNTEECLNRCLDSFLIKEIMGEIDVIIVNDGSVDHTKEIAEEYQAKYPGVFRVINKENGGHGSTINASVEIAKGEFFKTVDSDDWVESKGLIELVSFLSDSNADIVFSPYYEIDAKSLNKTRKEFVKDKIGFVGKEIGVESVADQLIPCMHTMTIRTDLIRRSTYRLDHNCYYVDAEYVAYYLINAKKVALLEQPVYDYLLGTETQSMNVRQLQKNRNDHYRVCQSLISFYEAEFGMMDLYMRNLLQRYVTNIMLTEYRLLLSLQNSNESKVEISNFDTYLHDHSKDIYENVIVEGRSYKSGSIEFISIMRRIRFTGYSFFHGILKNLFYRKLSL